MATREELNAKMAEIRESAEQNAQAYNELMLEGKYDAEIDGKIADLVGEYTSIARAIAFQDCKDTEHPMRAACINPSFDTIRAKQVPIEEGSKIKKLVIEDDSKRIDLKRLWKFCDKKLGDDPSWIYAAEQFNFRLTLRACQRHGIKAKEVNDSYAMAKLAKEFDLGKNPVSNTNILKTLTQVVQMMIGEEFKPNSHDVNRLVDVYCKADNRNLLKAKAANHNQMRGYLQAICHRILTGEAYELDYKKAKK